MMRIRKYQRDSLILCLDYEPGVVTQMLEYSYRYITSVLEDARLYANHARYGTVPTVSVADPGSGIRSLFDPWTRIRDPE